MSNKRTGSHQEHQKSQDGFAPRQRTDTDNTENTDCNSMRAAPNSAAQSVDSYDNAMGRSPITGRQRGGMNSSTDADTRNAVVAAAGAWVVGERFEQQGSAPSGPSEEDNRGTKRRASEASDVLSRVTGRSVQSPYVPRIRTTGENADRNINRASNAFTPEQYMTESPTGFTREGEDDNTLDPDDGDDEGDSESEDEYQATMDDGDDEDDKPNKDRSSRTPTR